MVKNMLLTGHRPQKRSIWLAGFTMIFLSLWSFLVAAHAESTAAISQGFNTSETNIATGALVGLTPNSKSSVQLSDVDHVSELVGVIGDKPLIQLSSTGQQVQVVISGITPALVSDINGDIKSGDKITASPITGVGMKATGSVLVVGTAQASLSSATTTQKSVNDKDGKPQTVKIGSIPIQVNITYYVPPEQKNAFLPPFLQSLANAVAGRDVSPVRVIVSTVALIFGFVSIAILLYSSTRSSIISIGRNPLSEGAVQKSLIEVGATALGILLVMLIAIYLVLTT